jgi:fungal type III polyketide synthase
VLRCDSLKKLLDINRTTGIDTRASVIDYGHDLDDIPFLGPSSISDLDSRFRADGVEIALEACRLALEEWGGSPRTITHTVAVTCTNQGNPGYDLLVARRLGIACTAQRTLLHGVGCAGGLAILRTAADIACAAAAKGKPARVLAFACELCTPILSHELAEAEACDNLDKLSIGAALFGDRAAAFVLCHEDGMMREVLGALYTSCGNGATKPYQTRWRI